MQLSLSALPPLNGSFVPRAADDRVGFWTLHYTELGAAADAASPLDLGPRAGYEFRDGARGRGYYASPELLRLAAGAAAEG